jgi:hypothetical protein
MPLSIAGSIRSGIHASALAAATIAKGSVVGTPKRIVDSPMTTVVVMIVDNKTNWIQASSAKAR